MSDLQMLVFGLGGQRYGFPLEHVREIVRAVAIAALPSAPEIVEGVVNLRGRPVAVLDLRRRLGVPPRELDPSEHLVVVEIGARLFAFRVDRAELLASVPTGALSSSSESLMPGVRHVERIATDEGGVVFIHDPAAFLSAAEADALDASLAEDAAMSAGTGAE